MKPFYVETIRHDEQDYPTVGNWHTLKGELSLVQVSEMGNRDYEFLVALHELVEAYLCVKRGITERDVTAFDIDYERKRVKGDDSEPGDDPKAPYRREHRFATKIERMMAKELGVKWAVYDRTVGAL